MSTLYLDRSGASLSLQRDTLIVEHADGRQSIPVELLARVVIAAKTHFDSATLNRLAETGVAIVLLDPHRCRRRAVVLNGHHGDAALRLAQYRAAHDERFRLAFSRSLVRAKLQRQRRWLAAVADPPLAVANACLTLDATLARLPHIGDRRVLRGLEGSAGRDFFHAYRHLLPPGAGFDGRRRRPPPDPVNACLSLGYVLLHIRAVQAAWAAGLDPMIGFYHEPAWGRESLACDLIEPWRPCIDAWVADWFGSGWLQAAHFSRQGNTVRLGKSGRQRFFGAFEKRMAPVQRALRRQVRALVRQLEAR